MAKVPHNEVADLLTTLNHEPEKLLVTDDEQKLDKLAVTLRDLLGDAVHITKSKPYFLEFTDPQATNGRTFTCLLVFSSAT